MAKESHNLEILTPASCTSFIRHALCVASLKIFNKMTFQWTSSSKMTVQRLETTPMNSNFVCRKMCWERCSKCGQIAVWQSYRAAPRGDRRQSSPLFDDKSRNSSLIFYLAGHINQYNFLVDTLGTGQQPAPNCKLKPEKIYLGLLSLNIVFTSVITSAGSC